MKIVAFDVADYEQSAFDHWKQAEDLELLCLPDRLNEKNAALARGAQGVSFLGHSKMTRPVMEALRAEGVAFLSTRTIGYDHIDLETAKELGLRVCNASYSPYNVADFTVMLMLMLLRKAKVSVIRALVNDFSLDDLQGREMHSLTVGVIGTGKIGCAVIRNLSGFGCRILCHSRSENPKLQGLAQYADLDTIYRESDIITLHLPLTESNYHMINRETIAKMKDGVLLINTARGALVDSEDLIKALESGKVGGAGIDTLEEEEGVCHVRVGTTILDKRTLLYLKQFPNVILTQHYAFFTKEAAQDMVDSSLQGLCAFARGEQNPREVRFQG